MTDISELDLLELFEVEPARDGYLLTYKVGSTGGVELLFLYNPIEQYIQTTLKHRGNEVMTTSCDTISRLWIDGNVLGAEFSYKGGQVQLELTVRPKLHVKWIGLRTA